MNTVTYFLLAAAAAPFAARAYLKFNALRGNAGATRSKATASS